MKAISNPILIPSKSFSEPQRRIGVFLELSDTFSKLKTSKSSSLEVQKLNSMMDHSYYIDFNQYARENVL